VKHWKVVLQKIVCPIEPLEEVNKTELVGLLMVEMGRERLLWP
jgi:hypothetical protein